MSDAFDPIAYATGEQRKATAPGHSAWVEANAGTGKTKVLTDRVTRLLLAGVRPERILCLTFTKAAAAEMRNRLASQLGRWAMADDAELTQAVARLIDAEPQAVVADQPGRERVIGQHELFAGLVDPGRIDHPGPQQCPPHPGGQLGRGLAGEGQAQHLLGGYLAAADQPHHPGRHHGGLARTGTGDDHTGLQRSGDRRELLI